MDWYQIGPKIVTCSRLATLHVWSRAWSVKRGILIDSWHFRLANGQISGPKVQCNLNKSVLKIRYRDSAAGRLYRSFFFKPRRGILSFTKLWPLLRLEKYCTTFILKFLCVFHQESGKIFKNCVWKYDGEQVHGYVAHLAFSVADFLKFT